MATALPRLISFSLFGRYPKYLRGMQRNIELCSEIYPDWQVVIYHDESIHDRELEHFAGQKVWLRDMSDSGISPASWRFLAHDENCERFMVRDADSRITRREAAAVDHWEASGRTLHIMRDHPLHDFRILGGMWGMLTVEGFCMREEILKHQGQRMEQARDRDQWWMTDQDFLKDVIYPRYANPRDSDIHNAMDFMSRVDWKHEHWALDFPTPINADKHFIGEIFDYDENGLEIREFQYRER